MNKSIVFLLLLFGSTPVFLFAQQDSTAIIDKKVVTLKEVVVRNNLNVAAFIERVKNDTTFIRHSEILRYLDILH